MDTPTWFRPALGGAVAGAIGISVLGFTAGGWMTGSKAREVAAAEARAEVGMVLGPICVKQAMMDPQRAEKLQKLKDASSYMRRDILMKTGWATMPGAESPNHDAAVACVEAISAEF